MIDIEFSQIEIAGGKIVLNLFKEAKMNFYH
jgi:hypothetical protein